MPLKGFLTAKVCSLSELLNSLITICVRGVLGDLPWRGCDSVGSPTGTFLSNFVFLLQGPKVFRIFHSLQAMRKETGDPKWDYDPVDVTDFLISQFKEGDLVEALDADSRRWRKGRILKVPQSGMTKDDRPLLNS